MNRSLKRQAVSWAIDIVFAIAAIGAVMYLHDNGWGLAMVRTQSMEPGIKRGDLVLSHEQPAGTTYAAGDVLVFTPRIAGQDSMPQFVHRVVEVQPDGRLVTQGDNNQDTDPWRVYPPDVHGELVATIPIHYLRHPAALPLLGGLLAASVAWSLLSRKQKESEPGEHAELGEDGR